MGVAKYAIIENMLTVVSCVACVVGLAAFTDGLWGWGFLIMFNMNSLSEIKESK